METTRQIDDRKESRPHNRRLAKKRVQCLNEALCFVSRSVLADSLVLRLPARTQSPATLAEILEKTDTK